MSTLKDTWTPSHNTCIESTGTVGGQGGFPFSAVGGVGGRLIKELTVWKTNCLMGLQILWTDGQKSVVYGSKRGECRSFEFMNGEKIKDLTLWGDGEGRRSGRILFTTDANRVFDWGKDTTGQTAYDKRVWSGYMAGVYGRAGEDIDSLGFYFLKRIKSIKVTNVRYHGSPVGSHHGIESVTLYTNSYTNSSDTPLDWDFSQSQERINTQTWMQSTSNTFGLNVTVEAKMWKLVKLKAGFKWDHTETSSHTTSHTSKASLEWKVKGTLEPKKAVQLKAVCRQGTLAVQYTSEVQLEFESGKIKFEEEGIFNGTVFGHVDVIVEESKD